MKKIFEVICTMPEDSETSCEFIDNCAYCPYAETKVYEVPDD